MTAQPAIAAVPGTPATPAADQAAADLTAIAARIRTFVRAISPVVGEQIAAASRQAMELAVREAMATPRISDPLLTLEMAATYGYILGLQQAEAGVVAALGTIVPAA